MRDARAGAHGALAVALLSAAFGGSFGCASWPGTASGASAGDTAWVGTWTASQQLTEPRNMPPSPGLGGSTLRQIIHVSLGGHVARVRLSNAFGDAPVTISAVRIARSAGGGAIATDAQPELSFAGRAGVTIPSGGEVASDPIGFDVEPLSDLAVTMYIPEAPAKVTGHPGSRTTSYIERGDRVSAAAMPGAVRTEHWYLLSDVEVVHARGAAVVVLGNSIADGRGSGTDRQNRWPDNLARRLQQDARTIDVAVLNAGIGGNCVLRACLGPVGVDRLERDVLAQRGARWLIVSEGVNDIGGARGPEASASVADALMHAYERIVARAHERGLRAYGATILPFGGSQYDAPEHEAARQRVNAWIRTSGAFDAVVDLDAAMRDRQQPSRLRADVDGGDHLHPDELGYRVMADAIDLSLFTGRAIAQPLRLAKPFSDGVVLQRGVPVRVWGWANAGVAVTASFRGQTGRTHADANGRWAVQFAAAEAGGPYELSVDAEEQHVRVANVLIGDVWVASGQSNMEFELSVASNAREAIAAAHDSSIRELKVPVSWSERPEDDLAGGSWAPADPRHAGNFSAVAYFFARELRQTQHVPIGIVNTSWGGSAIETWVSARAQGLPDDAASKALAAERARLASVRTALVARLKGAPAHDPGYVDGTAVWANPGLDETGWQPIEVPALWENQGYDGMDGVAWYRATFELSADEAARGASLSLGPIDDDDITWMNGVEIGRTKGYNLPRSYAVPASALRAGTNVLAIRVFDGQGGGGIYGAPDSVRLTITGGGVHPLAGTWKFRVGELSMQLDGQRINKVPAITYNRMLHPLLPFPIKGVIWYQGESNANSVEQAAAYRQQFATLIGSWRQEWRASGSSPDFPFLWVQLPNYGMWDSVPPLRSGWATLRESQTAALALPNTGQAITVDLGEAADLHPKNKLDVGKRLALVARRVAYGERLESSGPTYRAHRIQGNRVLVEFDHVGTGLGTKAPDIAVGGFAVAGPDRRFVRASARLDGDRVVVWSDRVPNPVAVRYAWTDDPENANLYSRDGLPAAPFRTDAW